MNRVLMTSFASLASLLATVAVEGTAAAQNFGQPPPPSSYTASYTSTAPPAQYRSTTVVAAPQTTAGNPSSDFGNQGNLSIGNDFGLDLSVRSVNSGPTVVGFTLLPAVDYFIIQNLSIGGAIGIAYTHTSEPDAGNTSASAHSLDFQIQPRVGYNIPVNPNFSVWPRLGLQYDHLDSGTSTSTTVGGVTQSSSTGGGSDAFGVAITVPVLWHPYEHYYLGLEPYLTADFVGDGKYTQAGIHFVVGGWL